MMYEHVLQGRDHLLAVLDDASTIDALYGSA